MKGKIAFGENSESFVTRLGMGFGYAEEVPKFKSKLCYSLHGFSIHAATRVNTHRKCECGSELKPVSAILKGDEIKRYPLPKRATLV